MQTFLSYKLKQLSISNQQSTIQSFAKVQAVKVEETVIEGIIEFVAEANILWFFAKINVTDVFAQDCKQGRIVGNIAPNGYRVLVGVKFLLLHYQQKVIDEIFRAGVIELVTEL